MKKKVPSIGLGKIDLESAYFQIPAREQTPLRIYNPEEKVFETFLSSTITFGNKHSVFSFVFLSALIEIIVVRFFGMPIYVYFDDHIIIHLSESIDLCTRVVEEFLLILGFRVAPKKTMSSVISKSLEILGIVYAIELSHISLSLSDRRKQCIMQMSTIILKDLNSRGFVSMKMIQKFVGSLVSFLTIPQAHTGMSISRAISLWSYEDSFNTLKHSSVAKAVLSENINQVFKLLQSPFLCIYMHNAAFRKVTLFTDAALEGTKVGLGAIVFLGDSTVAYSWIGDISDILPPSQPLKSLNIFVLELLAYFIAVSLLVPSEVKLLSYVDNQSAIRALLKGCSKNLIGCRIVNKTMNIKYEKSICSVIKYVESGKNPADFLTRIDLIKKIQVYNPQWFHLKTEVIAAQISSFSSTVQEFY